MALSPVLALALLQTTWVVDDSGGPGVNFTDIPPAIAAAADGDILLVQPGTYSHFILSGKGLRILGSGSSDTIVQNTGTTLTTTIVGLPSTSIAYVDRLRFERPSPNPGGVLVSIQGSTTQVALADVVFQGLGGETVLRVEGAAAWVFRSTVNGSVGFGSLPGDALEVGAGAFVNVSGSTLQGGGFGPFGFCPGTGGLDGGRGAWVHGGSELWIADSDVIGGYGSCCITSGGTRTCSNGGTALLVESSTARVSGVPATLLQGGFALCIAVPTAFFHPGYGILATGASSVVVHTVTVLPGACGIPFCSCLPVSATGGPGIQMLAPPLPVLDVTGNLSLSGGSATLSLANGPAGAPFFVGVTGVPDHVGAGPLFLGEFLVDPTAVFPLFSGVLSGTGEASLTIPLGGLPPSFAYFPFHFQGLALDPGGTFWRLSSSTVATLRP